MYEIIHVIIIYTNRPQVNSVGDLSVII